MEDVSYQSYYQCQAQDMSSYVAVTGTPSKDMCQVFGLTPREVRYLRVRNRDIWGNILVYDCFLSC